MRRFLFRAFALVFVGLITAGGFWAYGNQELLDCQLRCFHIGRAESYAEAQRQIAWFETQFDCDAKLQVLVSRWGEGNPQFDEYLARYVVDPASSDALRQAFSLQFARRPEQLPRWAHFWRYKASLPPDEAVESVLGYFETVATAEPARWITWRDVLDLQAILTLADCGELGQRLTPENYRGRCQKWIEAGRPKPAKLERPRTALPTA